MNSKFCVENFLVVEEKVNYPSGSGNSLQIKLNKNGVIRKIDQDIPEINFLFQPLNLIKTLPLNSQVGKVKDLFLLIE